MIHFHDFKYLDLVNDILTNGIRKENRTGVDTLAVFSRQMRFDLSEGSIPLLTTKKMHTRSIIYEILWYLQGGDNIKYLNDHGVTIWDEWAQEDGSLGPIYGYQWRKWPDPYGNPIDQVADVIYKLKNNYNDRRMIISAWNVGYLNQMRLPPCHLLFQFYVANNKLSCNMYQRSVDSGLGLPFNIVQYSILTHMFAQVTNLEPGEFIWNGGDVHIYVNHIDQLKEQVTREPYPSPRLKLNPEVKEIDDFKFEDFDIIDYKHHPLIRMEVAK